MKPNRALIISDDLDRRNFLHYHMRCHYLTPIWYPNIMSAVMAVRQGFFSMVVVDISIPIEPKLTLVREVYCRQPGIQVITIGKEEYLKKTRVFSSFLSVVNINSIELFPDRLRIAMFMESLEVTDILN